MDDNPTERLEKGDYKGAETLLRAEIAERSNHVGRTSQQTLKLATCLEKTGRAKEIPSVFSGRLSYYLKELQTVCESIDSLESQHSARYGKRAEVDANISRAEIRKMVQTVLTLLKDKGTGKKVYKKRLDPFAKSTGLPPEIFDLILASLSRLDLSSACGVSAEWEDAVITHSQLLKSATLPYSVTPAAVLATIEKRKKHNISHLTSMTFFKLESGTESAVVRAVLTSGLKIDSLDISGESLNFSGLRNCVSRDITRLSVAYNPEGKSDLTGLLASLPNLKEVTITINPSDGGARPIHEVKFKHLDSFCLQLGIRMPNGNLQDRFLDKCEFNGVKHLMLAVPSLLPQTQAGLFEQTRPEQIELEKFNTNTRNFIHTLTISQLRPTSLCLSGFSKNMFTGPPYNLFGDQALIRLTNLQLGTMNRVPWVELSDILAFNKGNLKSLTLVGKGNGVSLFSLFPDGDTYTDVMWKGSGFTFADLFRKFPRLESLSIFECNNFNDKRCNELGRALRLSGCKLKSLSLSCETITESGIRSLFDEDFALRSLDLHLGLDHYSKGSIEYLRRHCANVYYSSILGQRSFVEDRFVAKGLPL